MIIIRVLGFGYLDCQAQAAKAGSRDLGGPIEHGSRSLAWRERKASRLVARGNDEYDGRFTLCAYAMKVFLDFKSLSLALHSYPIEVVRVVEDGGPEAELIAPAPEWPLEPGR